MKRRTFLSIIMGAVLLSTALPLLADVRLPRLISNGAVLQRDVPVTVWGWADNGEKITVFLDGKKLAVTTTKHDKWSIELPPIAAGGPHRITVEANNKIELSDIYFGDVWIAAGQSNMELPMERVKYLYADEVATANNPNIRQFTVLRRYNFEKPQTDYNKGHWISAEKDEINQFSAVAYFFAKSLYKTQNVPIGIINTAVGGSRVESWMNEEQLKKFPHILAEATRFRSPGYLEKLLKDDESNGREWQQNLDKIDPGLNAKTPWYAVDYDSSEWQKIAVPGYWGTQALGKKDGTVWYKKTINLPKTVANKSGRLWLGRIVDADIAYVNGTKVGETTYEYPPRRYTLPSGILKPGKNTIVVRITAMESAGEAITDGISSGGFVPDKPYWLEVDGERYSLEGNWQFKVGALPQSPAPSVQFWDFMQPLGFYNAMFAPLTPMTIKGALWYQGESNVGRAQEYAQLLPLMIKQWRSEFNQGDFPFLIVQLANYRPQQQQPMESGWAELREAQRKTAMNVPNTALAVAIDAGEWNDIHPENKQIIGERLAYAANKLAYNEDIIYSGPSARCLKRHGKKATVYFDHVGSGLIAKGGPLQEFAIAGANKHYQWAKASIYKNTVKLEIPKNLTPPISIRYAWADNPAKANLYNAEGLPASPFEIKEGCKK